ncbi:hypothetical protein Poli38472_002041 [Pythium oligandrum]|uniref:PDZ domain-containing protein n=1 Tax=Pythium oligandrum TaxID=41045 RepID=A0A8K1CH30_PYTOL|nr:hypothetical protein Poli38472_002041 [Pythium oligandrum]|eukprot:TMW63100.1 hypothetical protein Poli38472_002041 [Pythium oligandrum]
MEAPSDELVEVIRSIIGVNDVVVSREQILVLLRKAENDPNKAVDIFFQAEANGEDFMADEPSSPAAATPPPASPHAQPKDVTIVRPMPAKEDRPATSKEAAELRELLGGQVSQEIIAELLRRTTNNLERAGELYFAEYSENSAGNRHEERGVEGNNHNDLFPAADSQEIKPVAPAHALEPLVPPPSPQNKGDAANNSSSTPPSSAELESLLAPGTYEVIMLESNFRWQIGNVFGRAVVQWVDPAGPAARAGVHKSDVLLSFRDTVVSEHNCTQIVQQLSKERVIVPSSMRLRRAPESHVPPPASTPAPAANTVEVASPPSSKKPVVEVTRKPSDVKRSNSSVVIEEDGDVVMGSGAPEVTIHRPRADPKYGLQILCQAVESMLDATGAENVEKKVLVDLLLLAEFNLDVAVNNFLNEHRVVSDFRKVIGHNWDSANPLKCMNVEPYKASIPAGPLGLTVENILERTIVVDIKPNGAAERASVKRSSWLVRLNGTEVTHLTHKETLRMIETAVRPLQLELILIPPEEYRLLRKQLSSNIRQPKTERPIPEQDRMSFRVFQLKIHQAVLVMPKLAVLALFKHLGSDQLAPLSGEHAYDPLAETFDPASEADARLLQEMHSMDEEVKGEMCDERQFLLNLFASIHEYDDKGESIVIRTIQFLGWLARGFSTLQKHVDSTRSRTKSSNGSARAQGVRQGRYTLLLSVIMHVLESLSIIENHATWDVMVDAFRLVIGAMTNEDVNEMIVPMISRLSISPSPTARIVPIALLSLVYPRVGGDLHVQLRGMLDRMCNDDNPLVRRAIASIIGGLVSASGAATASWGVQLLEKATGDSHDIVRIFAVKSCISLAQDLRRVLYTSADATKESVNETLRLLFCQMVPMVNTYTSDSSWQVRLEAARTLPAFCLAFGHDYTDVFVDHFVGMTRDPTVEIRRTCAEILFDMGSALIQLANQRRAAKAGVDNVEAVAAEFENIDLQSEAAAKCEFVVAAQTKIVRSLLPATYGLSTDLSVAVRLALAKSVGKSLQLLALNSYDDLVPIFTQILDESQDANVRASLLEEMARHCDHSSQTMSAMLVPAIKALRSSPLWRVRVKFVQCVGAWAEQSERSAVPVEFADATLEMLGDEIFDVRAEACKTLPTLTRSVGTDWLVNKVLPRVSHCMQSTFNGHLTALLAIESLAGELKTLDKLREVIETVVEECTSKTPNLRFRALRSLAFLVPLLDDPTTTESTIEFVRPLTLSEMEKDADVRDTATTTLQQLEEFRSRGVASASH